MPHPKVVAFSDETFVHTRVALRAVRRRTVRQRHASVRTANTSTAVSCVRAAPVGRHGCIGTTGVRLF